MNSELALWRAVVARALDDMAYGRIFDSRPAYHWIFTGSKDFFMVCDLALLNVDAVRDRARKLIDLKAQGRLPHKSIPANIKAVSLERAFDREACRV